MSIVIVLVDGWSHFTILEKLFRENKTSPLLRTPEKDFQFSLKTQFKLNENFKFKAKDLKNWLTKTSLAAKHANNF